MRSPAGLTPSVTPSPRPPDQWASEPLAPGPGRAGTGASQAPGCPPAAVSPPPVGTSPSLDTLGGDRHRSRPVSIVQRPAYALYTHLTCKHTVHTPHVAHTHCTRVQTPRMCTYTVHTCEHSSHMHILYTYVYTIGVHVGTHRTRMCTHFSYTHTVHTCSQLHTCAHSSHVHTPYMHMCTELVYMWAQNKNVYKQLTPAQYCTHVCIQLTCVHTTYTCHTCTHCIHFCTHITVCIIVHTCGQPHSGTHTTHESTHLAGTHTSHVHIHTSQGYTHCTHVYTPHMCTYTLYMCAHSS